MKTRGSMPQALAASLTAIAIVMAVTVQAMAQEADPMLVEAAQEEDALLIYSAVPLANWQGAIDAFTEKYPWFTAEVLELQSAEVYTRYEIEASSNAESADLLGSSIRPSWAAMAERGLVADIEVPMAEGFPEWGNEFPGVYTFSINPHVIAYNKLLIPEDQWPESIADVAQFVRDNPDDYNRMITAYTPDNAYGQELLYSWVRGFAGGDPWEIFETLVPATVEESSGGTMLAKLSAGEYKIGYFQSGNAVARSSNESFDRVIGWTIPSDGVPVNPFSAAVTSNAGSPATAELFLGFLVSQEGQTALPNDAGLNPILGTAPDGASYFTYATLAEQVGADNVLLSGATAEEADDVKAFHERWISLRN